jgi:hypothetical protein
VHCVTQSCPSLLDVLAAGAARSGRDILHVGVGMAIWLITVLLRRTSLRERTNLLPLLTLEVANELVDFIDGGASWTLATR